MINEKIMERAMADLAEAVSVDEITARSIEEIQAKYSLSDAQLREVGKMVLGARLEALEDGRKIIASQVDDLVGRARQWGRRAAELEIMETPLPWSGRHFAYLADLVVDNWAGHFEDHISEGDEFKTDLIAGMAFSARTGFIERIEELSTHSRGKGTA